MLLLAGGLGACMHPAGPDAESGPDSIPSLTSNQTAPVNTPLARPLVARVLNTSIHSIPNVTVIWSVDPNGGSVSPATSVTNNQGLATTVWTVGTTPGSYRARATTAELQGKSEAVFYATVLPAPAATADSGGK